MLKKQKFFTYIFMIIGLIICAGPKAIEISYAQDAPAISTEKNEPPRVPKNQNINLKYEKKILEIEQTLIAQKERSAENLKKFEELIDTQKNVIYGLELQVKSLSDKPLTNGTTFEVWSGILLGCVAIMVTVLSVMLAFFQYTGLQNAKREAKEAAEQVAHEITPKAAEDKLLEHMRQGGFNTVIEKAIDKIAFSNINDPENYDES